MAVVLTWALFACWATIGLAVMKLGRFRWTITTLLLAPTVGFATLLVPTYMIVRFGVPVRLTAVPIGGGLLALTLVVLWRTRPTAAHAARLWRRSRAFAVVLVGAFGLTAWPLFTYGFDWVANGNDDMANYCLMATGYREHAFADVPTADDLINGRDSTQAVWFLTVLRQVRAGADMLLALTSTWTGLAAQQVFMPVILALNLALVSAAGALALAGTRRRWAGVLTSGLLAVSAANTYGVVQQLIAQVGGLALLCAALALVAGRFRRLRTGVLLRRAGTCGLVFAGLLVFYPEVIPILVGGCVVLGVRELARGRLDRRHLAHAGAAIGVMAALLPVYLYGATTFLAEQSGAGGGSSEIVMEVFPYYLTPRAPALLWGFLPLAGTESAELQNVSIFFGFLLLIAVLGPTVVNLRGNRAYAAAFAVIAVLIVVLAGQRAAFGLFKIAMFAQPFLWAVVGAWVAARRARWALAVAGGLLIAVAGLNARVQFWYMDQSCGREQRVELPAATTRHVLSEFRTAYARHAGSGNLDRVLLATENNVLMKLLGAEVRGVPVGQIGVAPFDEMTGGGLSVIEGSSWLRFHGEWNERLLSIRTEFEGAQARGRFTILDPDTGVPLHKLIHPTPDRTTGAPNRLLVVSGGGSLTVFNRQRYPEDGPAIVCTPLSELHNFAVFCDATGARQLYFGMGEPEDIALYQLERDPNFRNRTMAVMGRALVLDVLNPTPQVRVLVNWTGSHKFDPAQRGVAPVRVVGDRRAALGAVGDGSARLVSPPLAPQARGPGRYLTLDFGEPTRNPNHLASAELLWGANLPRDRRRLTGHLRDVSVLSEEDYAAFRPPEQISKFPGDLTHPHLEYSGLYEEGWVGKEFKVRLTQPAPGQEAVIRGMIPQVSAEEAGFRTEMTVLIDGAPIEKRALKPGTFEVRTPGGALAGPRWIEVRFSHDQQLPAPDSRRTVALVAFVGFEPKNEALARPPEKLDTFPDDVSHPKADVLGIDTDRWCAKVFGATLRVVDPDREVVVRGQIPEIGGNTGYQTELTVLLDGVEIVKRTLKTGDFEVRAPGGKTAQARRLECRFSNTQVLPSPDGRVVGAYLRFVGFEPAKPGP